ncbi:tetratricopeptide repeat protein [Lyngbya aestuarii]|uniref:tetratricopeptide repeat protein n=1 Tax=Lyngbya aestuarii TaxID=118322 RepID=UPI00403D895D
MKNTKTEIQVLFSPANNSGRGKFPWSRWLTSFLFLGLVGGLTLSPIDFLVPAVQAQVPATVRRGYTLLEKGWVDDAIAAFQQALRSNPQSLEAKLGLAIAYQRAGRNAEAWTAYNQVLDKEPNNQTALKAVGEMGVYRSEWQTRGIEALTTLLELTPNDNQARSQRALLLGYQGRFTESLADYQILLPGNPTPETLLGAAQIYTYSGDYQQGLELFERYQATGKSIPNNVVTAYAQALVETGNSARAIQILETELRQAQKLDAQAIQMRAELAKAYQASGQLEQALAVLEPLRGREDAALALARSLSSIGRLERRADLYREATALYRQVLNSMPEPSLPLVREVADVLSELPSEWSTALELYQQLRQQQPNNLSLLVRQLILEGQLGRLSQTERQQRLLEALQPLPTEPAELRAIAKALVPLDPPDPALLPIYQNLLSTGVDEPFLYFRLAQILIQENQLTQAKEAIAAYRATSAGASDLTPELLLAEIDRREGNYEASAQRYQALTNQTSNQDLVTSALRGLAGIRLAQGRPDEALDLYDQLLRSNPDDLLVQLGRASIAYQTDRISEAEAEAVLNRWLQSQPATDAPPELFSIVGALPPTAERETLYNTLLSVNPDNIPIQLRRLQVIAERDPELAKSEVEKLIERDPDNLGAYFVQGELALALDDLKLASQAYQEVLARDPDNIGALLAMGGIRFTQRQLAAATKFYEQVLAINPRHPQARRNLAELSVAKDQPFTALDQFQALNSEQEVETGTPNPELVNRIQRLEVDILKRRGFQPYWERY